MTISSGLHGVGKTHLAVNLALEMVRRGRQAALFNQTSPRSSIDDLLALPQNQILQRRSTDHGNSLVRRGYQGIDIISSGVPLAQWGSVPEPAVEKTIVDMDIEDSYDDFLVDTSGMDPLSQVACCLASSLLVLIITPDIRSRSEAFALLRVLQLNGFEGDVYLLVNKAEQLVDGNELYSEFSLQIKQYLGLVVPLLGVLASDVHVGWAGRSRQAFSSLFPDADISSQTLVISDAIESAATVRQDIIDYWHRFREIFNAPVSLTGGVFLDMPDDAAEVMASPLPQGRDSGKDMILLQLDSSFHEFSGALDRLPGLLHATAEDVSSLQRLLEEDDPDSQAPMHQSQGSDSLLHFAVCLIREIERLVVPAQKLQLEVDESRVSGDTADWLQAGCYLKYIFRIPDQEDVLMQIQSMLAETTVFRQDIGQDGETIWEQVVTDRSGCLNIIHTPNVGIRVQVWLLAGTRPKTHQGGQKQPAAAVLTPSKMIH